ncbi:hypothetical protein [Leptobacterium sp. I13]|uniref:hypothetical protein n=1 Tax=Leptobacterium meishanense TaxID=3128904 RepID=UPI0030EF46EC
MKTLLCILITASLVIVSCQTTDRSSSSLLNYLPQDAMAIIKINDLQTFRNELKNNAFLQLTSETKLYKEFNEFLGLFKYIETEDELLLSFNEVGKDVYEYTLVAKEEASLFDLDSINDISKSSFLYETASVTKTEIDNKILYSVSLDGVIVCSSSQLIIENIIRQSRSNRFRVNEDLQKIYNTTNSNKPASVILRLTKTLSLLDDYFPKKKNAGIKKFADWVALDATIDHNALSFNGVSFSKDSTSKIAPLFYGTLPQKNLLASITPITADGFISYTYSDWETLQQNIITYQERLKAPRKLNTFFDFSDEMGLIYNDGNTVIAVHYTDPEAIKAAIDKELVLADEHRGVPIYEFSNTTLLVDTFSPLIENIVSKFYVVIDNFIVFADTITPLHNIIANHQNQSTIATIPSYNEMMLSINDKASILIVGNNPNFKEFISKNITDAYSKDITKLNLESYPHIVIQFVADKHFLHTNVIVKNIKEKDSPGMVYQLLNIKLDAAISGKPQFVTNHRTRKKEIAVQDIENNLYLISNEGKVLWKKKLNSPVKGKIHQVDLYRNSRLQLAFVTDDEFQILDRNGNEVAPFPLKFQQTISSPLAVFDYDKNKNYRFVFGVSKGVKMYDRNGKIIPGFTFTKTKGVIVGTPQHFRVGNKDYLVIAENNGTLNILDRRGNTRVKVNETFDFSENEVFFYQNTFMTTNKTGKRIQINRNGNISKIDMKLAANHKIAATSRTLVTLSDNILTIKDKSIELDFGVYTPPSIFYLYDKIYVALTDIQANQVRIFDSSGKLLPNFPVYGTGLIDMTDMDNDKKIEFVVQGEKDTILVYRIN